MPDQHTLTLTVSSAEQSRLEALARQRGYGSVADYLLALVESDVLEQADVLEFDSPEGMRAALRESWHQAMTDQTRPISELWEFDEDE